jgi:hypothetical protein
MLNLVKPDLSGLFSEGFEWAFAPIETCKSLKLYPNRIAFCEKQATLVLVVKRSTRGNDFALSEAGLQFVSAALDSRP